MKDEGVYASHAEFTTSGWSREDKHKVKVEGQLEKVCSIRRKHGRHPFN
jgi:hypothetical protein